jgi:enamine deaminase RidA (YjgF/YER057c/UK114 family)
MPAFAGIVRIRFEVMKSLLAAILLVCLTGDLGWSQRRSKKKERELQHELSLDPDPKKLKKEERPQSLETLKDPPQAVIVDTQRLSFYTSPLSGKGLLSQQIKDGLKALSNGMRGASLVKIRAFVAGTGDMRRVQALVSETFADRRQTIPALSVVQVGALPHEGAQVVMEATAVEKKTLAPHGIAFIAAQRGAAKDALAPLKAVLASASVLPAGVQRVTCFLDSLEHVDTVRTQVAAAFPEAASNYVQLRRDAGGDGVACEAVAALAAAPSKPVEFAGAPGGKEMVKLGPGKIALSGTQMAFGNEDGDFRLAFGRLDKALESVGTDAKQVVFTRVYALTNSGAQRITRLRSEYFDPSRQPVTSSLIFEALPSLDATIGIDVVALSK